MRRLALIPLVALAATACEEYPTGPSDGRPVSDIQLNTTTSSTSATLLGTTRACCRSTPETFSFLVELDPTTGETVSTIGPVGYAVNGLEYDATTGRLYGSTSAWDPSHVGLIEIDPYTGAGTPVGAQRWGFPGDGEIAITNITVNSQGQMFGWWEFGLLEQEIVEDDLVSIDKATGTATRVGDSGVGSFMNGLDFDASDVLYMVNVDGPVYTVDPVTGAATFTGRIGTNAHHGDFDPASNLYYGISGYPPSAVQALVVADLSTNTVMARLDLLDDNIHTVTFYQPGKAPKAPLAVDIDIKPGSCRNPVNVRSRGVLPMAILGTADFDVTQVDPKSLMLEGVSPIRWRVRDVATRNDGEGSNCHIERPDRLADLTLTFRNQAIVAALRDDGDDDDDDPEDGAVLSLRLTGNLREEYGGSAIEGQDVVVILNRGRRPRREWIRHVWEWARKRGSD
ncbi:MAG: hypothetical protein GTN75_15485 [Gemmatimonadetes bacterium]|nr:hypothetical protein [Gemmatimonadota bacterium]